MTLYVWPDIQLLEIPTWDPYWETYLYLVEYSFMLFRFNFSFFVENGLEKKKEVLLLIFNKAEKVNYCLLRKIHSEAFPGLPQASKMEWF